MILFMYFLFICLVNINCNEIDEKKVDDASVPTVMTLDLVRGEEVDKWIYSDKLVYCKLISPRGIVFYEHFGQCRLILDGVTMEHHGHWEMHVGYPEISTLKVEKLYVNVIEPVTKTKVHTVVEESSPNIMTMTCSLPSGYQVQGCKFRGPRDNLTILASGTVENIVNISDTWFESRLEASECSFRITNPRVRDLGFWRCAMFTENDTYYGFLTVLSSWFLHETAVVESIRRGPMLRVDHGHIDAIKDEPVTMSCSIDAPIRYCYFWMSDGTVLNVNPGVKSSSMEYVGSGFDAGECSLKVYDLDYSNIDRRWSCNVALATGTQQKRDFWINRNDRMKVSQFSYDPYRLMFLNGQIANTELEYCRYVQDDGFGFPYDSTPRGYIFVGSLSNGSCELKINFPTVWSDFSPWTIVAKVKGEDVEISGRTRGLPIPSDSVYVSHTNGWQIFGWVMLAVVITGILLGVSIGPQRNRQWMARRATTIRQSLHRQQPPPYTPAI